MKTPALAALLITACITSVADAQTCREGVCPISGRTQVAPANTFRPTTRGRDFARPNSDYGYSAFRTPYHDSCEACEFAEACRNCEPQQPYGSVGYTNFRSDDQTGRRYPAGARGYESYPNQVAPRNDFAPNYGRRDFDARDFRARNFGPQDFAPRSGESYRPIQGFGYDGGRRSNYAPRTNEGLNAPRYRGNQQDFRSRDQYVPRSGNDNLQYAPATRRSRDGFILTSTPPRSTTRGLSWETDLRRAAAAAQQSRRPLLVTVTADWCTHCRRMKAETFGDARLAADIQSGRYIAVRVDADRNQQLVAQMGIRSLPTTLVVSPDLKVVSTMQGFRSAEQLSQSIRGYRQNRIGAEVKDNVKVAVR